ncbi:MAG TPA: helix-turn-helix transcriptional regulator [Gaiellaceae bacterium]|nr:helix-turn-helix transcriptional regulator [Gaiellaceae bacterium]
MAAVAAAPRVDADEIRRRELGAFLRSRRERITPEQVGLRHSRRRRTPGLRREEVAQLAGVGVTWYTWLEQGRDIHASAQVLDAIARTLLFDPHERTHLFTLAGAADTTIADESQALPPSTRLLLDRLEPYPAIVVNGRYDILGFNRMWASGFPHVEALPFEDRNVLWLIFTDPHWRRVLPDWDDAASRMVAQFRAAMAEHVAEPAWKALVARLHRASPEFAEVWARHDVQAPESRVKRFRHPTAGLLNLDYTYLWLGQRLGTRIVTYTPADEETRRRLERVHRELSE